MKIRIPDTCPCCEYKLDKVNDQLFCRNTACPAQLNKKLEHFAKTLGIKGLGTKSVEKLNIQDITELFYLDRNSVVSALNSEKLADKLLNEIEKAKNADLDTVLASFSIPLIGSTASAKVASVVTHIEEINTETCKKAGLGEKASSNLLAWLATEYLELKEFLPFTFRASSGTNSDIKGTICITGKLKSFKTKTEAAKILEELGYKVTETVSKTTLFVVDEENKGSTKRKKADEYGIQIINNLIDFIQKVKND